MKATIKQIQGTTFAAKSDSNHWTIIDNSLLDDGAGAASGPVEMVLMALGTCSAVDVWLILKKMRANVTHFEINLDGERCEEHPRVFTRVHIEYILAGENLKEQDVQRAIQLSVDKYCTVAGMVGKTARIETSYRILEM